jgi:hypothetical protein
MPVGHHRQFAVEELLAARAALDLAAGRGGDRHMLDQHHVVCLDPMMVADRAAPHTSTGWQSCTVASTSLG